MTNYKSQFRALAYKNLALQQRKRASTCCQVFVPILFVMTIALVQTFGKLSVDVEMGRRNSISTWSWALTYENVLFTNPTDPSKGTAGTLSSDWVTSGMIGALPQNRVNRYYANESYDYLASPFFTEFSNESDMYASMNQEVQQTSPGEKFILMNRPDATINFKQVNYESESGPDVLDYVVQAGLMDDPRFSNYQQYDGKYPYNTFINMISSALYRNRTNSSAVLSGAITAAPSLNFAKANIVGNIACLILFPFCLAFLLPTYMLTIVEEKKAGLTQMMQVSGLSMNSYWLINFAYHFLIYLLFAAVMVGVGLGAGVPLFFDRTLSIIILILLWGVSQIIFSYIITTFVSSIGAANIIGFMLAIFGTLIGAFIELVVFGANPDRFPPFVYLLYPGFVFYHAFALIVFSTFSVKNYANYSWDSNFSKMHWILVLHIVVGILLVIYLSAVMPKDAGIRKSVFYPIHWVVDKFKARTNSRKLTGEREVLLETKIDLHDDDDWTSQTNEQDVIDEARSTRDGGGDGDGNGGGVMVKIMNLTKTYSASNGNAPKKALNHVSFRVMKNECFGLLGPNGAGKSTLINVLSGTTDPSTGTASIADLDIREDLVEVHKLIGVCPQFDVLWDDLTVIEHLLFYTRLKQYPTASERKHAHSVVEEVGLEEVENSLARGLSGGQRRRLSIAIAMMGAPKLILMDEPTTGLDPASRRGIWEIVMKAKEKHSIILSTHSMEEAEVLCSRIGIMRKAQLNSIGTQLQLKRKFDLGYNIKVSHVLNMDARAEEYMKSLLPNAILLHAFGGTQSYKVNMGEFVLSELFLKMEANKARHGIKAWSISQASLEEVFLSIVTEDESDAGLAPQGSPYGAVSW